MPFVGPIAAADETRISAKLTSKGNGILIFLVV